MTAPIPARDKTNCVGTLFGWKDIGPNCRADWHFKDFCIQHSAGHGWIMIQNYILMRTLAVNLRKNGSDLSQYASIIRMSSLLDEYGVDYATGEELLGKFLPTCYKLQWEPSDAVHTLQQVFSVCGKIWTFPNGARKFF